jgi:hypothetical protein
MPVNLILQKKVIYNRINLHHNLIIINYFVYYNYNNENYYFNINIDILFIS